jgi:hypothetical protein
MTSKKINPILLSIVLTFTFAIPVLAQTQSNTQTTESNPQQSTSILQAILSLFKSPENRLITRGSEVCPISPGNLGEQVIWSDRPLFIWQGKIPQSKINVYSAEVNYNYSRDRQVVWQETIPAKTQTITYAGEKLQPGFTYDWEFISNGKTYNPTFILMEQSQRQAIATELTALESQLKASSKTAEDIAIAKADYFLQQQLWSDALQQLYSVSNPSPDLTDKIKNIEQYLCRSTT